MRNSTFTKVGKYTTVNTPTEQVGQTPITEMVEIDGKLQYKTDGEFKEIGGSGGGNAKSFQLFNSDWQYDMTSERYVYEITQAMHQLPLASFYNVGMQVIASANHYENVIPNYTTTSSGTVLVYSLEPYDCFIWVGQATSEVPVQVKYQIIISDTPNGTVTADKTSAFAGETVTLTVTANDGYGVVDGSLKANGNPILNNQFIMPEETVTITCEFGFVVDTNPDPNVVYTATSGGNCSAKALNTSITSARISPMVKINGQPYTCTELEKQAFNGCSSLASVTIPNSVTRIGSNAFQSCRSLTSITIPDSVTSLSGYAFFECSSLKTVKIPNSVTSIGNYAFYGCRSLKTVKIPNSVTSIGILTFGDCINLTNVTIGNSVTSIGESAFKYCSVLTSITFNGTKSQYQAITKGADWHYKVPATVVHCTDGDTPI